MKKSEQLKEKAKHMISCGCDECTDKRTGKGTSFYPIYEYRFTESELQEYASEITGKRDELIKIQDSYIEFLGHDIESNMFMAYKTSDEVVEKGKKFRSDIKKFREFIKTK